MTLRSLIVAAAVLFGTLPVSSHYQLGSYGFGSGGTASSSSSDYSLNGSAGGVNGAGSSADYKAGAGVNYLQQADVPLATLYNDAQWYNKLRVVITPNGNPTDAKYAIALSTDGFTTTKYIQPDLTLSTSLVASDFQTYTQWGGSSGVIIRGLTPNSVYSGKAAASKGKYTQSAFGPASTGTTTYSPQLSFEIDVSATDQHTSPPYAIAFGNLLPGVVTSSPLKVWISLATNAESGGKVYIAGQNTGLTSATTGATIASSTTDLSTQSQGFGVQGSSVAQDPSSTTPMTIVSPYNGTGTNVGIANPTYQEIFDSTGPLVSGRGSFTLMAKTSAQTPAASDYTEILTAIAAAAF